MLRVLVSRQSRYPADTKALKESVRSVLRGHNVSDAEVSMALVGGRKMRELSKVYLNEENGMHEVLSFPYFAPGESGEFVMPEEGLLQLGDIVICYPEARKIAMKKNRMVDEVLRELAEHATLHLLGIHHDD